MRLLKQHKTTLFILTALVLSLLLYRLIPRSLLLGLLPANATRITRAPSAESLPPPPQQVSVSAGLPVRLKISRINVDAAIQPVGLASDGTMAMPKSLDQVGWFRPGQVPGLPGSAVIAGHYGGAELAAVFNSLGELRPGDTIQVVDEQAKVTTFVVRVSRNYSPKEDALDVFNSSDGTAHLNLVTCEGTWNESAQSYSQRLVVFTDKE